MSKPAALEDDAHSWREILLQRLLITSVKVDADETELQQVLFNLVLNARDALPEDGGKIQVKTSLVSQTSALDVVGSSLPPGRYAVLHVQDKRLRHRSCDSRAHLRALLHDEAGRSRHRPRPRQRAAHRYRKRRRHHSRIE